MAKNKRKVYGKDETGKDETAKTCAVCGCHHFYVYARDYATRKPTKWICRNCGTVVAAT